MKQNLVGTKIVPTCLEHNIDYLLHVDTDEFLFLNKFKTLNDMVEYYQPFDELNINWLIMSDDCVKRNKTDSLIKSSNISGKYLCFYTKSLTKVSSILWGRTSHNHTLKKNIEQSEILKSYHLPQEFYISANNKFLINGSDDKPIRKNILNEFTYSTEHKSDSGFLISECGEPRGTTINFQNAPVYLAHYLYKDIFLYVDRKLCLDDGNFSSLFAKWKYLDPLKKNEKVAKEKQELKEYHIQHKEDLIDYICAMRKNDIGNITKLENKHPIFKTHKEGYKTYYTSFGHTFDGKRTIYSTVRLDLKTIEEKGICGTPEIETTFPERLQITQIYNSDEDFFTINNDLIDFFYTNEYRYSKWKKLNT